MAFAIPLRNRGVEGRGGPSSKIVGFEQQHHRLLIERREEEESSRQ